MSDECPTCGAGRNEETDDLYAQLASLRTENKRLREALERIGKERTIEVPCDPTDDTKTEALCELCACEPHDDDCLIGIARAALRTTPGGPEPARRPAEEVARPFAKRWWNEPYPDGLVEPSPGLLAAFAAAIEADRASRATAPPELAAGPGMEPGQRCTGRVGIDHAHAFIPALAKFWENDGNPTDYPRCPYVQPDPPREPTCPGWCGTLWDSHQHAGGEIPYQDEPRLVRRTRCFCSPACRDAGRCLHPASTPTPQREPR